MRRPPDIGFSKKKGHLPGWVIMLIQTMPTLKNSNADFSSDIIKWYQCWQQQYQRKCEMWSFLKQCREHFLIFFTKVSLAVQISLKFLFFFKIYMDPKYLLFANLRFHTSSSIVVRRFPIYVFTKLFNIVCVDIKISIVVIDININVSVKLNQYHWVLLRDFFTTMQYTWKLD